MRPKQATAGSGGNCSPARRELHPGPGHRPCGPHPTRPAPVEPPRLRQQRYTDSARAGHTIGGTHRPTATPNTPICTVGGPHGHSWLGRFHLGSEPS
jgi:hypothetical protein